MNTPISANAALVPLVVPFAVDPAHDAELERVVDYIVDDCFFTVGQVVGSSRTLDYEAVIWWRDHYRAAFLSAMRRFGHQWRRDRDRVTAVAMLLAARALQHAGDRPSIDVVAAQRATEDVQRYCEVHASRRARAAARAGASEGELPRLAGYWCVPVEAPPPDDPDED